MGNIQNKKGEDLLGPSPFYDGKYHPPVISSTRATFAKTYFQIER